VEAPAKRALAGFIALAMIAVVICAGVRWYQSREPSFNGRRLSEWLDAYDTNWRFSGEQTPRSGFTDAEIDAALESIGSKAFPHLLGWLRAKDPPYHDRLNALLARFYPSQQVRASEP
jgi:hypothetical protein